VAELALNSYCGNKELTLSTNIITTLYLNSDCGSKEVTLSSIITSLTQQAFTAGSGTNGGIIDTPIIVREVIGPIKPSPDPRIIDQRNPQGSM
jgi:hypothetical protein